MTLEASCNGFPVPGSWVGFAEHWDDEVVCVLGNGFEVVSEAFFAQQWVGEQVDEEWFAGDDFFNFGEEVSDGFCSPFIPA